MCYSREKFLDCHAERFSIGPAARFRGRDFHHRSHLLFRGCARLGYRLFARAMTSSGDESLREIR